MKLKGIALSTIWIEWSKEDKKQLNASNESISLAFKNENELTAADFLETDFLLGNPSVQTLTKFKKLRWLQLISAGADVYTKHPDFPKKVTLTNATGTYGLTISEHLIATTLLLQRKLHLYLHNQEQEIWQSEGNIQSIYGSKVLIAGLGDIGTEYARRVQALGGYTIGMKHHIYGDEEAVDELYTSEKLDELLPRADVIACSLPSTPETYKMFGAAQFKRMKQNAIFLNVGRGDSVDLDALCQALTLGQIAGAALDVTDPEPLPKGHPAWHTPNLVITPHVSGAYTLAATKGRFLNIFLSNIEHFVNGEPLNNLVDFKTGYRKK